MSGVAGGTCQPHRFVLRWYRLHMLLSCGVMLSLGLLARPWAHPGIVSPLFFTAVLLLPWPWLIARSARCASVRFEQDEVVIRSVLRTRALQRDDVVAAGVTRGTSGGPLTWWVPFLERRDGSVVRIDEIRSRRADSIVDDVVAHAERWMLGDHPARQRRAS